MYFPWNWEFDSAFENFGIGGGLNPLPPVCHCIIVYQYSEAIMMRFLFSLLRIKGLNIFQALLAHPQEVLHKQHLVYCVRVMSVDCSQLT
jgi:hypothetical protein